MNEIPLMTTNDAAAYLQMHPAHVRAMLSNGRFEGVAKKLPGSSQWRFDPEALKRWALDDECEIEGAK